ncbi:hypothetical protein AADZ84_14350 [Colwelliaceae bacterium MEBiC 14330]
MLLFHIIVGSILLLSGIGALSFTKGSVKHRWSGNVFFIALLCMTSSAVILSDSPTMPLLSFYYGTTAWAVVLRKEKSTGLFEICAMLLIAYVSFDLFYFLATTTDTPQTFKVIFTIYAYIAALSALLDLNMIVRGGLSGKHRMVRHAWRTCFALLGAVMSFSANTSDNWPSFIDSNTLIYIMIVILFYWLIRVLFSNWYDHIKVMLGENLLTKKLMLYRRTLK